GKLTFRSSWTDPQWGGAVLDFWDDFAADGMLDERPKSGSVPVASVAHLETIPAGATQDFAFAIAWHFPNRYAWNVPEESRTQEDLIGNYYTTRFTDAWDVVRRAAEQLPDLERRTVSFISDFLSASLPD